MRSRSRTKTVKLDAFKKIVYTRTYDPGKGTDYTFLTNFSKVGLDHDERNESIQDVISLRPEVYVDPLTQKWKRVKYRHIAKYEGASRLFGQNRAFRPVQPCVHTKTVYKLKTNPGSEHVVVGSSRGSTWWNEYTISAENIGVLTKELTGFSGKFSAALNGSSQNYTTGSYRKIDWFALSQDFSESCESFTKESFLAGEALYECEIFVSAFRFIVNPLSALSKLTKFLRHGLPGETDRRFRKMTFGQFVRHTRNIAKKGVDAHLQYDFGVKPAIHDLIATLSAHDFVSRRMNYLANNGGNYIPIRVQQKISADVTNTPPGPLLPGVRSKLYTVCESKTSTGVISAWGRVRKDLDWSDTWSAYLQYFGANKLIGLAWELIPYSFVVDWVTNAQERINDLTRLRTGGPFCSIRGLSASLKEETVLQHMLLPGYHPTYGVQINNPIDPFLVCKKVTSTYSRYTSIPETSGIVDFSNLGLFHYTKLGELIFQFFAK